MSEQYQGKIVKYDPEKGFGFIASSEGDIFFHISDFPTETEPKRNDKVKFEAVKNGDKFKAVKIERLPDLSKKAKKSKVAAHNQAITSNLLSSFKR